MVPKQRSSESFSNLCLKFGKKFGENENTCVCVYIYTHNLENIHTNKCPVPRHFTRNIIENIIYKQFSVKILMLN
jgi:hypothetical protein